eukprot:g2168.t1
MSTYSAKLFLGFPVGKDGRRKTRTPLVSTNPVRFEPQRATKLKGMRRACSADEFRDNRETFLRDGFFATWFPMTLPGTAAGAADDEVTSATSGNLNNNTTTRSGSTSSLPPIRSLASSSSSGGLGAVSSASSLRLAREEIHEDGVATRVQNCLEDKRPFPTAALATPTLFAYEKIEKMSSTSSASLARRDFWELATQKNLWMAISAPQHLFPQSTGCVGGLQEACGCIEDYMTQVLNSAPPAVEQGTAVDLGEGAGEKAGASSSPKGGPAASVEAGREHREIVSFCYAWYARTAHVNAKVVYFHADGVPGNHVGLMDYWIATQKQHGRNSKEHLCQSLALARFCEKVLADPFLNVVVSGSRCSGCGGPAAPVVKLVQRGSDPALKLLSPIVAAAQGKVLVTQKQSAVLASILGAEDEELAADADGCSVLRPRDVLRLVEYVLNTTTGRLLGPASRTTGGFSSAVAQVLGRKPSATASKSITGSDVGFFRSPSASKKTATYPVSAPEADDYSTGEDEPEEGLSDMQSPASTTSFDAASSETGISQSQMRRKIRASFALNLDFLEILRDQLRSEEVSHCNFWLLHSKHKKSFPSTTLGVVPLPVNRLLEDPFQPGHTLFSSPSPTRNFLPDSPKNRRLMERGDAGGKSTVRYLNDARSALVFNTQGVYHSSIRMCGDQAPEDRSSIDFRVLSVQKHCLPKVMAHLVGTLLEKHL